MWHIRHDGLPSTVAKRRSGGPWLTANPKPDNPGERRNLSSETSMHQFIARPFAGSIVAGTCPVVRIMHVGPLLNSHSLDLALFHGGQVVVQRGKFCAGDAGIFLPEGAQLPDWLLQEMGLWDGLAGRGVLRGPAGNRVAMTRRRGVLSTGLLQTATMRRDGKVRMWLPPKTSGFQLATVDVGSCVAGLLGVMCTRS